METIYEGERAISGIQAGWDVQAAGKSIQVKTHAKAINNNSNFTAISSSSKVHIDELIILNFSPEFKLLEFYKLSWEEAKRHIKFSGKKNPREELSSYLYKMKHLEFKSTILESYFNLLQNFSDSAKQSLIGKLKKAMDKKTDKFPILFFDAWTNYPDFGISRSKPKK